MELHVHFGALCAPLAAQMQMDQRELEHEQRDADAISRLSVRGLLSEAETHRARKRLMKRLTKKFHQREPAEATP